MEQLNIYSYLSLSFWTLFSIIILYIYNKSIIFPSYLEEDKIKRIKTVLKPRIKGYKINNIKNITKRIEWDFNS